MDNEKSNNIDESLNKHTNTQSNISDEHKINHNKKSCACNCKMSHEDWLKKAPMMLDPSSGDEDKHPIYEKFVESDVVEVLFKGNRRAVFINPSKLELSIYDPVIVDSDNGTGYGEVCSCGSVALNKLRTVYNNELPHDKVVRKANDHDIRVKKQNDEDELEVVRKSTDLVHHYHLEMVITESEWQYDRQRLTIFFTASQRIDFRELVKDLARTFRTRIELRQISSREETKRLGCGIGACGLKLCCNNFLPQFNHVTLDHARKQQLSNNVAKLSGYCGRLKCCLLYEYDTYDKAFEKYPEMKSLVKTKEGIAKMLKVDVFKDIVFLFNDSKKKYITLTYDELKEYMDDGKVFRPREEEYLSKEEVAELKELQQLAEDDAPADEKKNQKKPYKGNRNGQNGLGQKNGANGKQKFNNGKPNGFKKQSRTDKPTPNTERTEKVNK